MEATDTRKALHFGARLTFSLAARARVAQLPLRRRPRLLADLTRGGPHTPPREMLTLLWIRDRARLLGLAVDENEPARTGEVAADEDPT